MKKILILLLLFSSHETKNIEFNNTYIISKVFCFKNIFHILMWIKKTKIFLLDFYWFCFSWNYRTISRFTIINKKKEQKYLFA